MLDRKSFHIVIYIFLLMIISTLTFSACKTPIVFESCEAGYCKVEARFTSTEECEKYRVQRSRACDTTMSPPSERKSTGSIGTFTCELISEEWDHKFMGTRYSHCR